MNYYIIGTKYGEYYNEDIFPKMRSKSSISIGFAWTYDLDYLVGEDKNKIKNELSRLGVEKSGIDQLPIFLNLKEGDLVAIKSKGSPIRKSPRLEIISYAIVKSINGNIYKHDPKGIGHLVFVDFIELDISKTLKLGYGKSIHKLSREDHIKKIFCNYYDYDSIHNESTLISGKRKGTSKRNTDEIPVNYSASYVIRNTHNKLQMEFYNNLVRIYGEKKVEMEQNYVDIRLTENNRITFFEVKPFSTAKKCIRESIGQLLEYVWKEKISKISLRVVGSSKITDSEKEYLKFVKENLNIDFDYIHFENENNGS